MALPSILSVRKRHTNGQISTSLGSQSTPSRYGNVSKADLKRATRTRRIAGMIASFCYFLSVIFLLLVIIGNINGSGALPSIYFFKLDLADIIPQSAPNANLINSIARTIGLHDFYQVGLWNFCEGYADSGITYCSKPQRLYWFNPVEILMSELLSGATIALPTQIIQILDILRLTSQIMFGLFIAGIVLNFVLMLLSFLAVRSRWVSLPFGIISGIAGLVVLAATVIGTVISVVFKIAAESQSSLNIHAYLGVKMFVFMWLAVGFTGLSFIIHSGMGCCCTSQRDIKIGRKRIREKSPRASSAGS